MLYIFLVTKIAFCLVYKATEMDALVSTLVALDGSNDKIQMADDGSLVTQTQHECSVRNAAPCGEVVNGHDWSC